MPSHFLPLIGLHSPSFATESRNTNTSGDSMAFIARGEIQPFYPLPDQKDLLLDRKGPHLSTLNTHSPRCLHFTVSFLLPKPVIFT